MSKETQNGETISFFSRDSFKRSSGIICLILGALFFIAGIVLMLCDIDWGEILFQIGEFLLASVLLSFFVNSARYMGAYKKELKEVLHSSEHSSELSSILNGVLNSEETKNNYYGSLQRIIYGKEFVSLRNDIDRIWDNVTLELFGDRFPGIEKDLLLSLKKYFPEDEQYYYSDHRIQYVLGWKDKEKGIISLKETQSIDIISKTKGKIEYDFSTSNRVEEGSPYECHLPNDSIFVDGKPCTNEQIQQLTNTGKGLYTDTWIIALEGKTKYNITYTRNEVYKLSDDFFIGFWAKRTVNGLKVTMTHPKDIKVMFIKRGTLKDFDRDVSDGVETDSNETLARIYDGLILREQGYVISLFAQ